MKALSIHQPWSWAILHGGKAVENRTWPTSYRGPLLIHASKSKASFDRQNADVWRDLYGVQLPSWESMVKGAIVGMAELVACVPVDGNGLSEQQCQWLKAHPFTEGPWCWILKSPRVFAEPIPYRGMQGLFEVPDDVIAGAVRI